ncbi:hypothetical protein J3R82DRAFT_10035 [Butyriboletus roseoflavus]|nr:hypothetical protein J3R82DRAFT_10035 [Butyriboletus roseoflavus]
MHHCLYISEVLGLIFESVRYWDDQCQREPQVGKKTLASLARTCHLFSPPALDILWHDLYSFDPLLKILPVATYCVDDTQWLTFRKYAKRIKTLHGREARVPVRFKQEIVSSLQHCPKTYLPLLPNVTELEWSEHSLSAIEDSGISLLRYFAGPAVTTVTISLVRWLAHSSAELAVFADLPRLCPNVTSFTVILSFSWDYEPSREVGRMVTQWPKLRKLQTCAITQPVMDQLFTRRALDTLSIDYHRSSPIYNGRIPDTVRKLSLGADSPSLCTRFLETVYASPTRFRLLIGMNEGQEEPDTEEMFHLLPRRLDTSRLLSLTIRPRSSIIGIPLWHTLRLREPLISALVEFTALRELDLDLLCTAQMSDADYARMAGSLIHLRSLKLGTANPSIMRPWPAASIGAVISVLTYCKHLETFHIVFDGSIPPPAPLGEPGCQGWGASNRCLTKLRVGYSPIGDATINVIASCFKSVMPCLVEIERRDREQEWRAVQNILGSY